MLGTCSQLVTAAMVVATLTTAYAAPSTETDLLMNPCYNHPVRHHRSAADKQLNNFNLILNTLDLKNLYPKSLKKVSGNCPRLNKMMGPIKRANDLKTAHERFYRSMIEFYIFLDRLRNLPIKTNVEFDFEKRRSLFDATKNNLRLTICEFNETMMLEHGIPTQELIKPPHVNTRCLPKSADLSRAQMLDMQFFKKIRKFFKQSKRHLKLIKRRTKSKKQKQKASPAS